MSEPLGVVEAPFIVGLTQIPGLGDVLLSKSLLKYGSAKKVFQLQFEAVTPWERKVHASISAADTDMVLERSSHLLDVLTRLGAHMVCLLDEEYPFGLSQLEKSPPVLYVQGELKPEDDYSVAIVGTRRPTPEGGNDAQRLAKAVAAKGTSVLSGLALGIDTRAHKGALEASGRTVAVVGTGLDTVYPRENGTLRDRILSGGGAVVSRFMPGVPPLKHNFPMRNWLMSGMAQGTVVVEASESSGAKLQAEYAALQGRMLFLTRKQVTKFEWARHLAEGGQAVVVDRVDDVLRELVPPERLSELPASISVANSLI
jgi:DNA processing protein